MDNVLKFIDNLNISKDDYVIVACSGGADSMYLLYLIKSLGYKTVCAHVNHKVRVESDDEYRFIEEYCLNNDIIFEGTELTGYTSGNFENFAREFRYNFFENILRKYDANYLFTAHHGDDLIETILMRISRGSSTKGYQGFNKLTKKKDYFIARPLIYLTKDQIEGLNEELNIPFKIDNTNLEDDYTRNRYRHHVLPFLKNEDPLVNLRFLKFSEDISETYDYVLRVVNDNLNRMYKDNVLNLNEFKKIDFYIQKEIIVNIFRILYPDNLYLVSGNHIDELMKLINSNKPNLEIILPNNIRVKKVYDKLIFDYKSNDMEEYKIEFVDNLNVMNMSFTKIDKSDDKSNYIIRLNSKDIKLPLYFRNKKDGDKMMVKNLNGKKKISDIFIDNKVPMEERIMYPLLIDDNDEILWVPGLKKSDFDIPFDSEYDIIIKCAKEKDYEKKI